MGKEFNLMPEKIVLVSKQFQGSEIRYKYYSDLLTAVNDVHPEYTIINLDALTRSDYALNATINALRSHRVINLENEKGFCKLLLQKDFDTPTKLTQPSIELLPNLSDSYSTVAIQGTLTSAISGGRIQLNMTLNTEWASNNLKKKHPVFIEVISPYSVIIVNPITYVPSLLTITAKEDETEAQKATRVSIDLKFTDMAGADLTTLDVALDEFIPVSVLVPFRFSTIRSS